MKKNEIYKRIEDYLNEFLIDNKFELVDIEYVKEGTDKYLRIYVDKEGGITIGDCELTSRYIEKLLDKEDFINEEYILEVSSPGLDRVLKREKDFENSIGKIVDIKLYKAIDKKKEFEGELLDFSDKTISIMDEDGNKILFNKDDIAIVRLAVIF